MIEKNLRKDGVVQIPSMLPLAVMRKFENCRAQLLANAEAQWCAGILNGTQAPNFYDLDLSFAPMLKDYVDSIDASILGTGYRQTHRLIAATLRLVSPFPLGYLNWHVDHTDGPGIFIKVLIFLSDVEIGHGDFCYVPGSHLNRDPGVEEFTARSNGYSRYPGRAGTAVMFDTAGVHAPSENLGPVARQTLLLSFARW